MSRKFQVKTVPSSWIEKQARRLDCGPYMSGAIEARELLRQLRVRKDHLQDLTEGGISGIINPGRITRLWVEDEQNGYPFLSSTDILQSDLSNVSYISKAAARQNSQLLIKERWTLITRSGTIGRMAYSRSDMNGMACTEDVLRVIPDESKIKPGYLYAYLSSKFGVPLVISGTYGSIITHLEPEHIADLPVPRLGKIEDKAHELICEAAALRVEASTALRHITKELEEEIGGGEVRWKNRHVQSSAIQIVSMKKFSERLDAFHYIGFVGEAIEKARVPLSEVGNYARALRPPILKRIKVDGTGIDFLGGRELLRMDQAADDQIALRTPNLEQFIVKEGMILFQCVGQRYGIFGTPVLANKRLVGRAVTEAVMRLIPHSPEDAGYIFTYLATGFGQRLVMRHSAGTSIPVLQEVGANKILIYWPDKARRLQIHEIASNAWEKRARAIELEDEARALVEHIIETGER
ncbi:TPA: restriction endonuclease subunit S [Klebsiella pneumoniae]|uniref:methylation-associated defense system restriction endonuclease subunit S MAD5 n=2 Tax=Klebsiella TaxID=570 RepID=UPI00080290DA|nr:MULTISPECIES: hypothetical protein [Klebsiella]HAJ3045571.1 restriction endonuclease subunit S [Escherichia coli]MBC4069761.1 restriction endonuclease subunit S [Klebsiella pneumoniae]MBZ6635877.1 restriction endonuclease subunit S [Klebsiella pneumoniae]MCJ7020317.1 restriction endonuclease subunit S [Klebsiella pneumoniae]MDE4672362.1 restriction endonuclease subunit S [Klebsiella pneumoniae]